MLQCDRGKRVTATFDKYNAMSWIFHLIVSFLSVAVVHLTSALSAPRILLLGNALLEAGIVLVRCINQQLYGSCAVNITWREAAYGERG